MWMLDRFRLDPTRFTLSVDGQAVALQRRPFDVLLYLVAHRDRVVPRDELLEAVWEGVIVSDGAVSTAVHELRTALGDLERSNRDRWITTIRGRGMRYSGPLEAIDERAPRSQEIPFVGRGEIVADLVERARPAGGGTVLLDGHAGMGKTRLLLELRRRCSECAFHVVQCERDGPPLWPWQQLARAIAMQPEVADVGIPRWLLSGSEAIEAPASSVERVEQIAAWLRGVAQLQPTIVAIEDLHWADRASLTLLESLAPRAGELGVLLILTERSRDESAEREHGLAESPFVKHLRLGPLETRDLFALVRSILSRPPEPEQVGLIEQASRGNPLIARELASRLAAGDEEWGEVPALAHRVFASRIERLSHESRTGLGIAALCGNEFDAPLVEAAAGDALTSDRGWIEHAVDAEIVRPMREHPLRFRFTHSLLRDAAEGMIKRSEVPTLHDRIARALERQHPEPTGRALSRLARHSAEASAVDPDLGRPLEFALRAARRAARELDWVEVGRHTRHALGWIEYRPPGPERDRQEIEAILLRSASIAWGSGHVEETTNLLERLAPVLERTGTAYQKRVADAFRFANARIVGRHGEAAECVASVAQDPDYAFLATHWQVVLDVLEGRLEEALERGPAPAEIEKHRQAIDGLARDSGRDPEIDRLTFAAFAAWGRGLDARAVEFVEQAITWAERRGDERGRIWAMVNLCLIHELRCDWASLAASAPEIDRASKATGVSTWLGLGLGLAAWAKANAEGDHGVPLGLLASILRDRAESTGTSRTPLLFLLAARMNLWCGDGEVAEQAIRGGIDVAVRGGEQYPLAELLRLLAEVRAEAGDVDEAASLLERALEVARRHGHRVFELRILCDRVGRTRASESDRKRLGELSDLIGPTMGPTERARVARFIADESGAERKSS